MKLHPDHLADLRKSGLNDETLLACRFQTVSAGELERLGSHYEDVVSAYWIPYWGLRGDKIDFARLKLFPPIKDTDGHTQKYWQASGSCPYLYLPPLMDWAGIAADPHRPVIITEGEKKSACGCQYGLAVIGIGGCWCWRTNNEDDGKVVLPDFDWFAWQDREVELCPDSDGWRPDKRMEILAAFFALGKELERRGAHVSMVSLPDE
jgi:hypothetical protein